ncbi:hypothetical protein EJ02DRAFT_449408 [Clathrospora elynae]|uniref:DUF4148 domain-containing protein n=1 Tax=Clathrospora elynae TaxID=706981 RepID=A0A6A5TGC7_9PLEO|nr:hypothetical protein EJ02DRAFT_449408 [Clathrospora elynae]
MLSKTLVMLTVAFSGINVLAAPVAPAAEVVARDSPTEFRGAQYAHSYKEAADAGLTEREVVAPRQATEFRGAQYVHLYKEAADAGLAERDE